MDDLGHGQGHGHGGSQAPRGILKNSSRFSSHPPAERNQMMGMNVNPPPEGAWVGGGGSQSVGLGAMAAGVNPGPPVVIPKGSEQGLERAIQHKLSDFMVRKSGMLYKPLTEDEMPLADAKGFQYNCEEHYGIVPSLDHFMRTDSSEIKRYFSQNLQVGDILIGSVYSKGNHGLIVKLMTTDGGKHIILEDLGIKVFCPANQLVPTGATGDNKFDYRNDDLVRVEVLELPDENNGQDKAICGMKGNTMSPDMMHNFHLGLIKKEELPLQLTLAAKESESRHRRSFDNVLATRPGFHNPSNVEHLASTMGIFSNRNSLMVGLREEFPKKESGSYLRRIQNGKWAHGNVADGIKFFKMGKFTEAFQCLNKALSIDPENAEGLVARGALYANNGSFEKAIEDLEAALKFNPNHFNARKYLAETLVAFGKQQETAGKIEDAVASYSKCLVVKPDHKEAKEALWSLYERTKKLDMAKLAGPAVIKATELKEKLKAILQTDLGMKLDEGKGKKKKKKGKKGSSEESSSSSSDSESDSDSSSSEDSDGKGKKRKKSKKKRRKSKKAKKAAKLEDGKGRVASLSPFSKRLVDQGHGAGASGSGLAGFGESSFAEWGQQLGISKLEKEDSDEESKRSQKKSKDKKRSKKKDKRKKRKRATSSSSGSESDEDSSSKDRKKSKHASANSSQNLGGGGVIPDLGDLEAKLSAYYSKIEQEKLVEPSVIMIPPDAVQITVDRHGQGHGHVQRDAYHDPVRKIELKQEAGGLPGWTEDRLGKIELRTDEYGNFLQPAQMQIIRTVHNDIPVSEPKPIKFEIKAKQTAQQQPPSERGDGGGSKWRPLGTAPPPGSETSPRKPAIKNPFELQKFDSDNENEKEKGKDDNRDRDRNLRGRARSTSRERGRKRKSRSRSRSSSSYSSRSRSRSRSRDRERFRGRPARRFDDRDRRDFRDRDRRDFRDRDRDRDRDYRGRGNVRFFRGYNRGVRRPFIPRGGGGGGRGGYGYRPNGPAHSKFRNRFSRSASKSRSRSRSRSKSGSRSRSREKQERRERERVRDERKSTEHTERNGDRASHKPEKDEGPVPGPQAPSEIQVGELTTTKASDVEELLDKRNAEKKEEMRKSNPEFFRS